MVNHIGKIATSIVKYPLVFSRNNSRSYRIRLDNHVRVCRSASVASFGINHYYGIVISLAVLMPTNCSYCITCHKLHVRQVAHQYTGIEKNERQKKKL